MCKEDLFILECALKTLDYFHVDHAETVTLTSDGHSCIAKNDGLEFLTPFIGCSINSVAIYVAEKLGKHPKYVKD